MARKEPSILDHLKLIDPINIQIMQGAAPLILLDTHFMTGINIDHHPYTTFIWPCASGAVYPEVFVEDLRQQKCTVAYNYGALWLRAVLETEI